MTASPEPREALDLAALVRTARATRESTPLYDLRRLIGPEAEQLAYLNCAVDHRSMDLALLADRPPFRLRDRLTRSVCELTAPAFDELLHVQLADWLEQVPHSRIGAYRPDTQRRIAHRLGAAPLASFQSIAARADGSR